MSTNLSGLGRFADSALFVLASLASGPKHGYAIMRDVHREAGVQMGPGTLYGAIARLEKRGWIAALPAEDRRHPYTLTEEGRRVLTEECTQLRRFAESVLLQDAVP
ncbi:MAG TPA: helix-turn-helix transcriptional regulator [Candidatus Dormibacteraeota bacterium]|nr:helix-turn-helix transcriptional regulator [Candidatus Dormibacteraeota bacterium]